MTRKPDTIVLIHGLWMTARSWENWVDRYTKKGYRVIAKSWPGMDVDIDEIRRNPAPLAKLDIDEILAQYENIIRGLENPPIIMGHSFGALFTEILVDRGFGVAGVAIAPAPLKGIIFLPFPAIKAAFPAVGNPANVHRALPLTPEQFHYAFANTLSDTDSMAAYNRYAVPGPDHVLFQDVYANLNPNSATAVDFHNDLRAPLLLIGGGKDHTVPASVVKAAFNLLSKSKAVTEYKEYPDRAHFTLGEPGWEEVADYALDWAVKTAALPRYLSASGVGA